MVPTYMVMEIYLAFCLDVAQGHMKGAPMVMDYSLLNIYQLYLTLGEITSKLPDSTGRSFLTVV